MGFIPEPSQTSLATRVQGQGRKKNYVNEDCFFQIHQTNIVALLIAGDVCDHAILDTHKNPRPKWEEVLHGKTMMETVNLLSRKQV